MNNSNYTQSAPIKMLIRSNSANYAKAIRYINTYPGADNSIVSIGKNCFEILSYEDHLVIDSVESISDKFAETILILNQLMGRGISIHFLAPQCRFIYSKSSDQFDQLAAMLEYCRVAYQKRHEVTASKKVA